MSGFYSEWKKILIKFLLGNESGQFYVSAGKHEVFLPLDFEPKEVWIKLSEKHLPICGGNVNKIGWHLLPNGVVFYLDVVSDKCKIKWYVKY